MFEAQTYDKVLEEILSRAPDGIDLRQGSIFYDAVAGIAFKIAKYYADLEQVFEMVFLVTATGDYLTLKAEISIHALREEGDTLQTLSSTSTT